MEEINSICRVCLSEYKLGVSIFYMQNDVIYCDLIKDYIGLEMVENKNLPNMICNECEGELKIAVKFISKCRSSHTQLDKILNSKSQVLVDSYFIEKSQSELLVKVKEEVIEIKYEKFDSPFGLVDKEESDQEDETSFLEKKESTNALKSRVQKYSTAGKYKKRKWKCSDCGSMWTSKLALVNHIRTHTGERPFKCPSCFKSFSTKRRMEGHSLRHSRVKTPTKFVCEVCGRECPKRTALKIHMRVHTAEKPYHCPICPKSYSQAGPLAKHTKMIHSGERPFSCEECEKSFVCRGALKLHMSVHSDERNFKCDICEKHFKAKTGLHVHIASVHKMEKSYPCEICSRIFSTSSTLKRHTNAKHSSLSGFCKQCNKTFSNLPTHMRRHTGETPYECHICHKKFTIQRSLLIHSMRHTNENKYPCTYADCKVAFSLENQLKFHISKIHKKMHTHFCEFCSRGFYRKKDAVTHISQKYCKMLSSN